MTATRDMEAKSERRIGFILCGTEVAKDQKIYTPIIREAIQQRNAFEKERGHIAFYKPYTLSAKDVGTAVDNVRYILDEEKITDIVLITTDVTRLHDQYVEGERIAKVADPDGGLKLLETLAEMACLPQHCAIIATAGVEPVQMRLAANGLNVPPENVIAKDQPDELADFVAHAIDMIALARPIRRGVIASCAVQGRPT